MWEKSFSETVCSPGEQFQHPIGCHRPSRYLKNRVLSIGRETRLKVNGSLIHSYMITDIIGHSHSEMVTCTGLRLIFLSILVLILVIIVEPFLYVEPSPLS